MMADGRTRIKIQMNAVYNPLRQQTFYLHGWCLIIQPEMDIHLGVLVDTTIICDFVTYDPRAQSKIRLMTDGSMLALVMVNRLRRLRLCNCSVI